MFGRAGSVKMSLQQIKCEDCGQLIVSNNSRELKRRFEEHKKKHQKEMFELKRSK
jgi:hypothetical protein